MMTASSDSRLIGAISIVAMLVVVVFVALTQRVLAQNQANQPSMVSPYALEEQAMKAYESKHYAESAQSFDAAFSAGLSRSEDAYDAACSYALAGNTTKALAYLEEASSLGFRETDRMKGDPDLRSLHSDSQFRRVIQHVQENQREYELRHRDPDKAAIVTSDIDLFWVMYDRLQTSAHPEAMLESEYLRRGSPGLQDFIFARIHSAADLWNTMKGAPHYYAALRSSTNRIREFTPRIRQSFHKMADLYAESTFPDVYFLVGRMNSGGTTGSAGLLIGADMFGKAENAPLNELDEWHHSSVSAVTDIPCTVAHELIHYQQNTDGNTLLAAAIREGSADFVGRIISGELMNQAAHKYGLQHESELWEQFSRDMDGTETSHWMYEGKVVNGRPADLAYFEGYRITEAYYDSAQDKRRAIIEILNFKDAHKLLNDSGYPARFSKQRG